MVVINFCITALARGRSALGHTPLSVSQVEGMETLLIYMSEMQQLPGGVMVKRAIGPHTLTKA
ncbi:hypothetical protein QUB60_08200 [Microcoleus sp. A2-C5]|uniref:hypothetical protein n=1 Tax=unclassified Microcoleus TaxID=2642155 RepID=UPI002FD10AE5|nr:hypothetical protein [Lyngbya sp. CCAP 1446/10]